MTENMKNLDEEIAQQIKNDHIKKMVFTARNYSLEDVETIVCGNLNTIAYEYEKALTAQRQSWEREKEELIAESKRAEKEWGYKSEDHYIDKCRRQEAESRIRILEAEKQALEAEKKGLEEWVSELQAKLLLEAGRWSDENLKNKALEEREKSHDQMICRQMKRIDDLTQETFGYKGELTRLKSRNEELEAKEYQLRDNIERAYADAKRINPDYDWEGLTQTAQIAVWGLESLILRLKAKVAELEAELQATRKACDQAHQNTLDRDEEIDRLKAELHEATLRASEYKTEWESALYREQGLKAENAELKDNLQDTICSYCCEGETTKLRAERDRLTSALVAAHEALKGIMYKRIKDNDALEFAEYVLGDKEGTLAFEKWKKIVEAVEQFVQCGECSTCSCCLDVGKEALEALDAKGCEVDPGGQVNKIHKLIEKATNNEAKGGVSE